MTRNNILSSIRKNIICSLFLFLQVIFCEQTKGQYLSKVKDISPITESSDAQNYIKVGNSIFFCAFTNENGTELWKTDGTEIGTSLIKDINPGVANGVGGTDVYKFFTVINNQLFLVASDGSDAQLWKTDGTESGTIKLTSNAYSFEYPMIEMNGNLYFFMNGNILYKSDGTTSGTTLVKNGFTNLPYPNPPYFTKYNNSLYFVSCSSSNGYELWKSDGTTLGTSLFKDINPGSADGLADEIGFNPSFTEMNGKLYFLAQTTSNGMELWTTDGTIGGTQMVKDINPGSGHGFPALGSDEILLKTINNKLYFRASDGVNGFEPWVSDGTDTGTVMLVNINPTGNSTSKNFTELNGNIVFSAYAPSLGTNLYSTDGTVNGTQLINNLNSLGNLDNLYPRAFISLNGFLYFISGLVNGTPFQVIKTNGTLNNAQTILTGGYTNFASGLSPEQTWSYANNNLYFSYTDTSNITALWKINGLSNNAEFIKEINFQSGNPYAVAISSSLQLIFTANDSIALGEPFISDGTTSGTHLLKDVNNTGNSFISNMIDYNSTLLFSAHDQYNGFGFWKSSGIESNTNRLNYLSSLSQSISAPFCFNNSLFYLQYDPNNINNTQFIKSHGASNSTNLHSFDPYQDVNYHIMDTTLILYTEDALWKYNENTIDSIESYNNYGELFFGKNVIYNTTYGNVKKITIANNSSHYSSLPSSTGNFQILNDTLLFLNTYSAYDTIWFDSINYYLAGPYNYDKLMKTDGISGATDLNFSGHISSVFEFKNKLYFSGYINNNYGLYYIKNTNETPHLICNGFGANVLAECNNILYYANYDSIHGVELWTHDFNSGISSLLKDLNPSGDSYPAEAHILNGRVYFLAHNGTSYNLWESDGSNVGTIQISNFNNALIPYSNKLTVSGSYLYFVANGDSTGHELWSYTRDNSYDCFAHYETQYDSLLNSFNIDIDPITSSQAISYQWDFGDGTYSTLASPTHHYSQSGFYNVCLTAYTANGDSCKYCHFLGKDTYGNIVRSEGFDLNVNQVGIKDLESKKTLHIIPNPSNGLFKIMLPENESVISVKVINSSGISIKEFNQLENGTLNITSQSSGVFFVIIQTTTGLYKAKLLKM